MTSEYSKSIIHILNIICETVPTTWLLLACGIVYIEIMLKRSKRKFCVNNLFNFILTIFIF